MSGRRSLPRIAARLVEIALALLVVAGFAATLGFFLERGHLPVPFIFDVNDTFMDWFNTAYWANNEGAYSVWRTVYPPLSFVFLRIFSLSACYASSPFHARDCDWLSQAALAGFYLIDIILVYLALRRIDPRTAPMRAVAFALGLPLLFTLERGNLILPCLAFFVVAHTPLTTSKWLQSLGHAVSINFKPYLLLPVLALAVKREWRTLELAGLATLLVYLVTLAIVGAGTPMEMVANTANWVRFTSGLVWEQSYFSTSYAPFLLVEAQQFPIRDFVPSRTIDFLVGFIPRLILAGQAVTLLCLAGAWLQPDSVSRHRLSTLLMAMFLSQQSPGGYTLAFLVFLVFLEPWRRPGPIIALVAAYLLCIPYDHMVSVLWETSNNSWLGGRSVNADFGLTIGTLVRPALVILILWALALDSLAAIVRAHFAHRPRYGFRPGPREPRRPARA